MGDRRRRRRRGHDPGDRLATPAAAARAILPLVVAAGRPCSPSFERARPTLEDVFLELVGPASPDELDGRGFVRPREAGPSWPASASLLRKELLEQWRTLRLPVVAAVFLLVGLSSPLLARFTPELLKAVGGDQLQIVLPTPTAADAVDQLVKNLGQFGALVAVLLAMGAVATEKERGTAGLILTEAGRPRRVPRREARRDRRHAGGRGRRWPPPRPGSTRSSCSSRSRSPGVAASAVLQWLALMAWAAITFLASTLTRSALAAAGSASSRSSSIGVLSAFPAIAPYLPTGLGAPARALALGRRSTDAAAARSSRRSPSSARAVAIAWLSFRRQEL